MPLPPRPQVVPTISPWATVFDVLTLIETHDSKWIDNPTFPESPRPPRRLPK